MSSIGAGLNQQCGFANETTVNTPVAVTVFLKINSHTVTRRPNFSQGMGLGGNLMVEAARRIETSHDAGGDIVVNVQGKGMGKILQLMQGSYDATAVQLSTSAAYQQIHNLESADGHSATIQVGIPSTDGTINPFTLSGVKVTAWQLACAANGQATLTITIDAMDIQPVGSGALALQAASYPTGPIEFGFNQLTVGIFSAYTTVSGLWTPTSPTSPGVVRAFTLKGGTPKDVTRWQGGSVIKGEQLSNDFTPVTGTVDIDYGSNALYTLHAGNTPTGIEFALTGPIIASAHPYLLGAVMPACFLEAGSTPQVSGPGITTVSYPFTAELDSTGNGIQFQYISTDTTV